MFRNEVKYRVSFLLLTEHVTLDISMSILIVNISKILFYDKYDISEGMDVITVSLEIFEHDFFTYNKCMKQVSWFDGKTFEFYWSYNDVY